MSTSAAPVLPAALTLGAVHLTVPRQTRAIAWYETALGLCLHSHGDGEATLGDGRTASVVLHEDRAATPAGRTTGLYHFALLYPTREELARAALRLEATGTAIQGASDHETHEAIYLADADGNGIELAADRPRSSWPEHLGYADGPQPLDVGGLMATIDGEAPQPRVGEGLRIGHLHLHVGDVGQGLAFYSGVVGFAPTASLGSAAFVSAGGYHHHLGFNVWNGKGAGPPRSHAVGLRTWTVVLPEDDRAALRTRLEAAGHPTDDAPDGFVVRDPWGTAMTVTS